MLLAQAYLLAIALVLLAIPLYNSQRERAEGADGAVERAQLTAALAGAHIARDDRRSREAVQTLALRTLSSMRRDGERDPLARVIVVDARGRRIADSLLAGPPAELRRFPRDELTAALSGRSVQLSRRSEDLDAEIRVTAEPVVRGGAVLGAVRITEGAKAIEQRVQGRLRRLGIATLIVIGMGLVVAVILSRLLLRPMRALETAVRRVSGGDLSARAPVTGSPEQRVVANAFNDMAERVERLLASQEEFVANASHQLRTPLTGLRLRVELLRRRSPGDRAALGHADEALSEVDRLSGIIDELLELSRVGQDKRELVQVDLNDAARAAAERWAPAAAGADVSIVVQASDEPSKVSCTAAGLDRALDVLLENALAYGPGESTIELEVGAGRVHVRDDGPGLAQGEEEEVFGRFQRGRAGRREGARGSGLGLAIARQLIEGCDGSVTLRNRAGGGAEATISLTRVDMPRPAARDFTSA